MAGMIDQKFQPAIDGYDEYSRKYKYQNCLTRKNGSFRTHFCQAFSKAKDKSTYGKYRRLATTSSLQRHVSGTP